MRRNLRTVVRGEAERLDEFIPRHFEISLPKSGVRVGDVAITGRIDRVDEREWVAEALIWDYKSGTVGALGANVLERGRLQMPLYIRAAAELLGRDVVGGLYQSIRGDEAPRGVLRDDVREAGALEGFASRDYVEPELFEQLLDEAAERAGEFAGRMKVGDVFTIPPRASARRGAAGTASAGWRTHERRLVSAISRSRRSRRAGDRRRGRSGHGQDDARDRARARGAGDGTAPERVLVVTYTDAAARELAVRLERALPAGVDAARPQVGTIHALAARLLREYAAEAGLPSELRVLDEAEALVLSEAAFADAIARERRDGRPCCSTCSASTAWPARAR